MLDVLDCTPETLPAKQLALLLRQVGAGWYGTEAVWGPRCIVASSQLTGRSIKY